MGAITGVLLILADHTAQGALVLGHEAHGSGSAGESEQTLFYQQVKLGGEEFPPGHRGNEGGPPVPTPTTATITAGTEGLAAPALDTPPVGVESQGGRHDVTVVDM